MEKKSENKNNRYSLKHPDLLNSMMDGFVFVDMNGIILDSNKSYREMLGYTDEELEQLTYKDITPEKWHTAENKIVKEQILPRGFSDVYEKEYRKKDGTIFPVELRTFLSKNDKGENEGMWAIVRDISRRMKIIKAQKTSELNFINIAEQASDGIFIIVDGIIKYCNQALATMGGYTIDELIGTSFLNYVHPDLINIIADRHKRRMAGEDIPSLYETQLRYKNGSFGDAEINVSFIGYNGGKALMVMVRDITERKRSEEIINRQHTTLQGILESSTSPIFSVDTNYCYTSFNNAHAKVMEQIYGVQIKLGKSILEYQSVAEDRAIAKINIDRSLAGEFHTQEAFSGEIGRSRLYFEVTHNPIKNSENQVVGAAIIGRDVTERKKAEIALHQSEQKYRFLFERNQAGVYRTTLDGQWVECNDKFAQMLGYPSAEELKIHPVEDVYFSSGDRKEFITQLQTNGCLENYEIQLKLKNKKSISILENVILLPEQNDQPAMIQGTCVDITDRKRTEEALKESEERLRTIIETEPECVKVIDADGQLLEMNSAGLAMLEANTLREVQEHTLTAFILPEYRTAFLDLHKRVMKGETGILEFEVIGLKGTRRWLETHAAPILNTNGEAVSLLGVTRDITARKYAESALRISEEKMRGIFRVAPTAIGVVNDRIIMEVNPQTCEMTGYAREELIGKNARMLYPTQEESEFVGREKYKQIAEKGSGVVETRWMKKDGSIISIILASTPIISDDLSKGVIFTALDITERKLAEQSLVRLQRAVEASGEVIFMTDPEGVITFINPEFTQLYGFDKNEVVGKATPRILKSGIMNAGDYESLWQAILSKQTVNGEITNRTKDGRLILIESAVNSILDEHGNITGFLAIQRDITKRKQAEDALLDSEKKFKDIVEWSPIGIYQSTPDGDFITVNASLASMLGYVNIEEMMKINIRDCYYNYNEREKLIANYDKGAMGNVASLEVYWKKKDGKPISILLSAHSIRDDEGKTKYYEGFVLDITDRKSLEVQLLRTQRLDSLGTLASGIAHDLNNVLSPILLSVEMLRRYSSDEKSQNVLSTLTTNVIRGRDIIKQVLTFARGFKTEHDILQSKHIIKEILNIAHETFPKNIRVTSDVASDLWVVKGDATQLHQVLMNLSLNARDAIDGHGTIVISASNFIADRQFAKMQIQAHEGNYIKITVRDTGHGIPPDIMEKIFDPFFTTKEIGKGTGLGLSTSHSIVKEHGGFIDVNSEIGKGTTFYIYLPAVEEIEHKNIPAETVKLIPGKGEGVLIVDDEVSILDIIKQTLELYGYHTFTAKDGIEGIAVYAQNRDKIDLVLIDMMMPVMDGIQMYNALRKFNDKIPVITMSGEKLDILSNGKSLSGIGAHLQKPYTAEILLKTLREVLEK